MKIIRIYRLLASEIFEWWEAFCFFAPGLIGAHLRRRILNKRLNYCGLEVFIGLRTVITGWQNISIGSNTGFTADCFLAAQTGRLSIGENVSVGKGVFIGADFGSISIGDNTMIGPYTVLRCANHETKDTPKILIRDQGHVASSIEIGDDVWIGANVSILPGASIGDHVVVAAGSVVRGQFPSSVLIAGVPAKIIKTFA